MEKQYEEKTMYVCKACGKVFAFKEHVEEHSNECIKNPNAFKGSTTDKNTKIMIKAPTEKSNGYKDFRLLEWLGQKNTLVVDTEEGYRELDEDEIFEENKEGYEPIELGEDLETIRSEKWQYQLDLLQQGIEEQREINESIQEFWKDIEPEIKEMEESGINGKDLSKELKDKYNIVS